MKQIIIIIILVSLLKIAVCQVSFQPVMPAGGLIQKNQLWNAVMVNNSNQKFKAAIDLVLFDRKTGLEVLTATSGHFDVLPGSKQLNANMLQPIQYNYLGGWVDTRGLLPIGLYTACYKVSQLISNKTVTVAEECTAFDVEPLSPPMLIFPADSSVWDKDPQQFSWVPPTPANLFSNLHYEIIITEINNNQRAPEAIQNNLPFFNQGNVYSNSIPYTSSSVSFAPNKWYAWQVIAKDNSNYVSKSEIWTFQVGDSLRSDNPVVIPYIKLEARAGEVSIVKKGQLRMEYFNYLADSSVKVWIYNEADRNEFEKLSKPVVLHVKPGQNFLQHNLGNRFKEGDSSIYEAMLLNSRGERFYMKFKNTK